MSQPLSAHPDLVVIRINYTSLTLVGRRNVIRLIVQIRHNIRVQLGHVGIVVIIQMNWEVEIDLASTVMCLMVTLSFSSHHHTKFVWSITEPIYIAGSSNQFKN